MYLLLHVMLQLMNVRLEIVVIVVFSHFMLCLLKFIRKRNVLLKKLFDTLRFFLKKMRAENSKIQIFLSSSTFRQRPGPLQNGKTCFL